MARQAARSLIRPVTSPLPLCWRRAYAPALESGPVASTSQTVLRPPSLDPESGKSGKGSTNRSKGKERASEAEVLKEGKARPGDANRAASEVNAHSSRGSEDGSASATDNTGATSSEHESRTSGPTFPAAQYPASEALSPGSTGSALKLEMLRHPFNTHVFVENLISAGMPRERAEVLMEAARILALREADRAQQTLVSKVAADNDSYLYSAALSELRTEIQVDVREETLAQRSANARVHRRIESLSQTTSEQVEGLKSEIKYEFQHSRDETNADFKNMELRLQDVTNRIGLMFGRERAELESLKWILLRNIFLSVAGFALAAVMINEVTRERPKLPTVEAFGIKPIEDPESELVESPVRRVGEEDDGTA